LKDKKKEIPTTSRVSDGDERTVLATTSSVGRESNNAGKGSIRLTYRTKETKFLTAKLDHKTRFVQSSFGSFLGFWFLVFWSVGGVLLFFA